MFKLLDKIPWDKIKKEILESTTRFPLSILCGIALAILYYLTIHKYYPWIEFEKYIFTLQIALPIFISAQLIHERYFKEKKLLIYAVSLVLLLLYFFFIYNIEYKDWNYIKFLTILIVAHSSVSFVGFYKEKNNAGIYNFNLHLLQQVIIGGFYCACIVIGINGAILAIDTLFKGEFNHNIYIDTFIITLFLFHPIYFTSQIPNFDELNQEEPQGNKFIEILVKFLFIPFSIIYFLILYAYGIKLLIDWELPIGWISKLCIGFSAIGIITYVLNTAYKNSKNNYHKNYSSYFFWSLIPVIILHFIGIFYRIDEYGFTEFRYIIALLAIGLSLLTIYFLRSKKLLIKTIPVLFSIMGLLIVIGPWNAHQISLYSQASRFENQLLKQNLIVDSKIDISKLNMMDDSVKKELFDNLQFFISRKNTTKIDQFFPNELVEKTIDYKYDYSSVHPYSKFVDSLGYHDSHLYNEQYVWINDEHYLNEIIELKSYSKCIPFDLEEQTTNEQINIKNKYLVYNKSDSIPVIELLLSNNINLEGSNTAKMKLKCNIQQTGALLILKEISLKMHHAGDRKIDHVVGLLFIE